jgi:glycine/D-amino acid oxidase-like deaminating enzyme
MAAYGHSYWETTSKPAAPGASRRSKATTRLLQGNLTADVVVIGGGFTGCAAAYTLSQAGLDVVLVEANRLASGSTERSIGAVLPIPDLPLVSVQKTAGKREARVAFTELRRSAGDLASTLKRLGVRCDFAGLPLIVNAPFTNDASLLQKEATARKAIKLDAAWLTPAMARQTLVTETQGAMRLRDAGDLAFEAFEIYRSILQERCAKNRDASVKRCLAMRAHANSSTSTAQIISLPASSRSGVAINPSSEIENPIIIVATSAPLG